MSTLLEDRPLSADEYALTRWLLEHGFPGADAHLDALDHAWVVGRCGCGCASVDFVVDGRRPPHGATYEVLADYQWRDAAGHLGGVFAFARAGVLAGLEVWSVNGAADTTAAGARRAGAARHARAHLGVADPWTHSPRCTS